MNKYVLGIALLLMIYANAIVSTKFLNELFPITLIIFFHQTIKCLF